MSCVGLYACVSLSLYLPVLLCTIGYICQYEVVSLEAECWACCGEINSGGRWLIVETEISLLQKPLQKHLASTKFALSQERTLGWRRRSNPSDSLICAYLGLRTELRMRYAQI